jgi:hypothetical protein
MTFGLSSLSYNFFAAQSTGAQSKTTPRKMHAAKVNRRNKMADCKRNQVQTTWEYKKRKGGVQSAVGWGGGGGWRGAAVG